MGCRDNIIKGTIMKKILSIVILSVILSGCSDYLFRKNDNQFWGKVTPEIGKIVNN